MNNDKNNLNSKEQIMSHIEFNENMATGVKEIDEQHQLLIRLINFLRDSIDSNKGEKVIRATIERMGFYASYHFKTEENLMDEYQYPDSSEEISEHKMFINKTNTWLENENCSDLEVLDFLRDWLHNHILITDKKLGAYLNSKGVS